MKSLAGHLLSYRMLAKIDLLPKYLQCAFLQTLNKPKYYIISKMHERLLKKYKITCTDITVLKFLSISQHHIYCILASQYFTKSSHIFIIYNILIF